MDPVVLEGFVLDPETAHAPELAIVHEPCGEIICTAEPDDTLAVLVRTALSHWQECDA